MSRRGGLRCADRGTRNDVGGRRVEHSQGSTGKVTASTLERHTRFPLLCRGLHNTCWDGSGMVRVIEVRLELRSVCRLLKRLYEPMLVFEERRKKKRRVGRRTSGADGIQTVIVAELASFAKGCGVG